MKKFFIGFIAFILIAFGFFACELQSGQNEHNGNDDDSGNGNGLTGLRIIGAIGQARHVSTSSSESISDEIESVLLFYQNYFRKIGVNNDGTFEIPVSRMSPVGLIFVGSEGSFKGFLEFTDGGTTIPLHYVQDELSVIDLGTLNPYGTSYKSSLSIDDTLSLTPIERRRYEAMATFFNHTIRNPDITNNGIVDILEGIRVDPNLQYNIQPVYEFDFDSNSILDFVEVELISEEKIPVKPDSWQIYIGLCYNYLEGVGDPLSEEKDPESKVKLEHSTAGVVPRTEDRDRHYPQNYHMTYGWNAEPEIPKLGTYTFSVINDSTNLALEYSFSITESYVDSDFILVFKPTLELREDNTVRAISWEWLDRNLEAIENPENYLSQLDIALYGTDHERLFKEYHIRLDSERLVIEDEKIHIDEVENIPVFYHDIFRTAYSKNLYRKTTHK